MADPELFCRTYFVDTFSQPFTDDRRAMMQAIIDAAIYGGDQAIAGPRGEGKSRIAYYSALFLALNGLSVFPIIIGKSQTKAQSDLKTIKERLQQTQILIDDFPEIGIPFQKVGGWSSRARMQTVGGRSTNIEMAADHFIFPTISREQLDWDCDVEPISNGQIMSSLGVDGPIRGTNYRDRRPTLAIIDDIEDREAATSMVTISKNEEIIENDIGGLGQSGTRVSRVMLCTTQNRRCIAYRFTDPKEKPSWRGRRYRKMIRQPDRMDLVDQYMEKRKMRADNDPDARDAFRFWRDNKSEMESGAIVSNELAFDRRLHLDGEPLELSAIHAYYNQVADRGQKAVSTEDDNDPPEEAGPMGIGLTPRIVANRLSGLSRRQLPMNTLALTAAIDLGKYYCHWVITAWWSGAGGVIVDYGVVEVIGTDTGQNNEASEPQVYRALLAWRDELLQKQFVDASGEEHKIAFCLVDSGAFTNAAYEFCRQVKGIFHPSKGQNPYHAKKQNSDTIIAGSNLHASKLTTQGIWLYELDSSYWKQWVHERFLTPTFDETNMLRRGSLSLFQPDTDRGHISYSHHVTAEELVTEFKEGKGTKTFWNVKNDNNHWLDATAMAAAASEVCGIKLIAASETTVEPRRVDKDAPKPIKQNQKPHGRFRTRPGGWVPGRKQWRG